MGYTFCRLSAVDGFLDLKENIRQNELQWQKYAQQINANEINFSIDFYRMNLSLFQQLLIFRCFQPTKLVIALHHYVCKILGSEFIESSPFDLASAFGDSTCCKPLLFILSSNYDPMKCIRQLAETQLIDRNRIKSLSMGQQQNELAINLIEDGIKSGDWVILQNCHLANDWMHVLERICDNLAPDTVCPDFRLWLTTESTATFPLSIIHSCVKLVDEPPKHLRGTLLRTFTTQPLTNEYWLNENKHKNPLKMLLFSLSFMHAAILERRNFDSIGWNRPYDFNDTDLLVSIYQFYEYLNAFQSIQCETLQTLLAECNYGGHMNDFCDLRCLKYFSKFFCSSEFCANGKFEHQLLKIEAYFPTSYTHIESIVAHIKSLDDKTDTAICGLHENANVFRETNETNFLTTNITLAQVSLKLYFIQ